MLSKLIAAQASPQLNVPGGTQSSHPALRKEWDLNGDGVIDEADALFVRAAVVRLEGGAG